MLVLTLSWYTYFKAEHFDFYQIFKEHFCEGTSFLMPPTEYLNTILFSTYRERNKKHSLSPSVGLPYRP